jgi:ComF family protein
MFLMTFSFLDLLFPKKCVSCGRWGTYLCRDCFAGIEFVENPVCPLCQRQAVGGRTHPGCRNRWRLDGLVVACKYKGPVKKAIKKVKYRWVYDIEKVFVDLLCERFWRFDFPNEAVLTPVPLHVTRKRWRGFNQSEILAKQLAKKFNVAYRDLVIRIADTKTQVGLDRRERKENVKGAFALAKGAKVEGKNIFLVDDVYTSGATMGEVCRVLKKAGAKSVFGIAVALG